VPAKKKTHRAPLSRERVLHAAIQVADAGGLEALSMRTIGHALGVEAMSLYNHVAGKDEILDAMADFVVGKIELPAPGQDWKAAMRRRATSAREALLRHPWALRVMETRKNPGPASMRYYEAVIGCLRQGGFSIAMAAHAFSALDSYIYGFVLQEVKLPFKNSQELADLAAKMLPRMPTAEFPYFTEMIVEHTLKPGYSYANEFAFGLDLILDALAGMRDGG
jgi:AcrR family transcriptional regulator